MNQEEVVERWIEQRINNRQGKVSWSANNLYCRGNKMYSYGEHFVISILKEEFNNKNVFFFNTQYYSSSTSQQQATVRWKVGKNGYVIAFDFSNFNNFCPPIEDFVVTDIEVRDHRYGSEKAVINNVLYAFDGNIILLKEPVQTVAEAEKQIACHDHMITLSEVIRWRNYYFVDTGLNDKEFAKAQGITETALKKFTYHTVIPSPELGVLKCGLKGYGWNSIKAKAFGYGKVPESFKKPESIFVTGKVYGVDLKYGKTIANIKDTWFLVEPMYCDGWYPEK